MRLSTFWVCVLVCAGGLILLDGILYYTVGYTTRTVCILIAGVGSLVGLVAADRLAATQRSDEDDR